MVDRSLNANPTLSSVCPRRANAIRAAGGWQPWPSNFGILVETFGWVFAALAGCYYTGRLNPFKFTWISGISRSAGLRRQTEIAPSERGGGRPRSALSSAG
jgi:hypothetical protein